MTSTTAKAATARQKQSDNDKRATLDQLKSKPRATTEFSVFLNTEDGEKVEVTLKFGAIGMRAYDKLVSNHPPTPEQRTDGASFNMDTFAPALISACALEPEMSEKDAKEIWNSETWSRGDVMVLFRQAVELNNRGLDIPFSEAD